MFKKVFTKIFSTPSTDTFPRQSTTPDYYVDSVNGSDTNSGKAQGSSFQTISKLLTVMVAGEHVSLAKGSTWREQLTIPGDDCTVSSHGSGNKPILDCSDVETGWTLTGGETFTYQATVSFDGTAASSWMNVWEDGVFLTRAANQAAVEATPGSYFPSDETASSMTLYIHTSDSANPTSNGKTYEFSRRLYGLLAETYSGTIVDGIHTKRNVSINGSMFVGLTSRITDCVTEDGNKHNMFVRGGSFIRGCLIDNCYYGGNNTLLFVAFESTGSNRDVYIESSTCQIDTASLLVSGFSAHTTTGNFGTITLSGCTSTNCVSGYNIADTTLTIINNSTSTTTGLATGAGVVTGGAVQINGGSFTGYHSIQATTGADYTIRGGAVLEANGAAGHVVHGVTAGAYSVDMQNCTVTDCISWVVQSSAPNATHIFQNMTYNSLTLGYDMAEATTVALLNSDFNSWNQEAITTRLDGTTYNNMTDYIAGEGQDTNSTVGP